jgi:hypothetical protein
MLDTLEEAYKEIIGSNNFLEPFFFHDDCSSKTEGIRSSVSRLKRGFWQGLQ